MRQTFEIVDKWIKDNPEYVQEVKSTDMNLGIKHIIYWHEQVCENKDLILGDKLVSLDDIKKFMINSLTYNPIETGDKSPYDEDGHCSDYMYIQIKEYWNDLTEESLKDVLTGKFLDNDLDLDGGRSYLLSMDGLLHMLFNYMHYTLRWTKDDYDSKIYNSIELTDDLKCLYPPDLSFIEKRDFKHELEAIKKIKSDSYAGFMVKYPIELKKDADSNKSLEFVCYSILDKCPIYKIKIPNGSSVVYNLDSHLQK